MANKKTPKKKSNIQSYVIGIIVLVIIVIGAYAVIRAPGSQTASQSTNPTSSPTASTPSATPTTTPTATSTATPTTVTGTKVLLQTSAGDITIQLRTDKPITTANFINIVQKGWYNGTTFHRVIAGFMIQGGSITENTPTIKDEIGTNNHNTKYTIAMAKTSSPNSATSEFFINVADNSGITYSDGSTFDGTYTVFGTVISGQSVVDAIANAPVTTSATGENSQPVNPVTIIKASIVT
ncbi:MAG: peptidylprolyl isomerase [Candidatus Bathyarchaeia archaeon]|jgi:cyclophilin family peptidyl-prolyl cis-trans isomerase